MNTPLHNPNDNSVWSDQQPSLWSVVCPLHIGISRTTAGWLVDISSLTPSDAIARDDLLEKSSILCRSESPHWIGCLQRSIRSGGGMCVHVREYDDALRLGACAIARYATTLLGEQASPPDLGLVDRVLERSGHLSITPNETEIFSTFVDIGISTNGFDEPADIVLIYDIFSDTWHGD